VVTTYPPVQADVVVDHEADVVGKVLGSIWRISLSMKYVITYGLVSAIEYKNFVPHCHKNFWSFLDYILSLILGYFLFYINTT
jgi:hypothetical protein